MEATYDPALVDDASPPPDDRWRPAPPPDPDAPPAPAPAAREQAAPPAGTPNTARSNTARSNTATSAAPAPSDSAPRVRSSWAGRLLEIDTDARTLVRRGAIGLGLAGVYGLALGAREGGVALLTHAVGVPAAILAVTALGLPALYILLALFNAPLSVSKAAAAAVRGVASGGLVLAGLAPLCSLYVVTSASDDGAAIAGVAGLALGGGLGLRHLVATLREALAGADSATRLLATLAQIGFAMFAVLLAWRVWTGLLPLVGGAS